MYKSHFRIANVKTYIHFMNPESDIYYLMYQLIGSLVSDYRLFLSSFKLLCVFFFRFSVSVSKNRIQLAYLRFIQSFWIVSYILNAFQSQYWKCSFDKLMKVCLLFFVLCLFVARCRCRLNICVSWINRLRCHSNKVKNAYFQQSLNIKQLPEWLNWFDFD